jgi:hypothetical protein
MLFYLKFKAILALKKYSDSKSNLRRKGTKAHRVHKINVFSKFFSSWHELYKYYSSIMKESVAKDSLARAVFLKRFLHSWSLYSKQNLYKRRALDLCA